uniref:Gag-pol polyprotein n=1 Tax=Solanum tuberosum TaxID=4113 RepID=M1D9T4_SOLTU
MVGKLLELSFQHHQVCAIPSSVKSEGDQFSQLEIHARAWRKEVKGEEKHKITKIVRFSCGFHQGIDPTRYIIMTPRRAFRGRPARRNVEEQGVPNAPEVQPQEEVTNAEFCEAIRILNAERVELAAYQMKGVARVWFHQWKKNRVEDVPIVSWVVFESAIMGRFFPLAPPDRAASRGATSSTGGETNRLYPINSRQEQEDSPDVVTGMIQVFDFTVFALLDPGVSLSFVTSYVAMNFDVLPEQLSEPFSVSTHVGEFILTERVYRDCPISVNHKSTMADLILS